MAMYIARWPDGSFSIVQADDEGKAYELLDEFGDEPAEVSFLKNCTIDFELTDRGSFRLCQFGGLTLNEIQERGYPLLEKALDTARAADDYSPYESEIVNTDDVLKCVSDAVKAERIRLASLPATPASTKVGRQIQEQTNVSGRYADELVNRAAKQRLAKFRPGSK